MFANIENPPETVNVTFQQNDFMNICPISMTLVVVSVGLWNFKFDGQKLVIFYD